MSMPPTVHPVDARQRDPGVIDWTQPAAALAGPAGAWPAVRLGDRFAFAAGVAVGDGQGRPGEVLAVRAGGIEVATADGSLLLRGLVEATGVHLDPSELARRGVVVGSWLDRADSSGVPAAVTPAGVLADTEIERLWHGLPWLGLPFPAPARADPATGHLTAAIAVADADTAIAAFVLLLARASQTWRFAIGHVGPAGHDGEACANGLQPGLYSSLRPLVVDIDASQPVARLRDALRSARSLHDGRVFRCDAPLRLPLDATTRAAIVTPAVVVAERGGVPPPAALALVVDARGIHLAGHGGRFDAATLQRIADGIDAIAHRLGSSTPCGDVCILGERERDQLAAWNATAAEYPRAATVTSEIDDAAGRWPGAIAVTDAAGSVDHATFGRRTNQLARHLVAAGVRPGDRVGVLLSRTATLVESLVAVMKAGAAYVPLDATYPLDRLQLLVADANACLVLTESRHAHLLPPDRRVLRLDEATASIAAEDPSPLPPRASADAPAYVIYTSGSTGRPKGVVVRHRNVVNLFAGLDACIPERAGTWLAVTSVCFDISVLELFWTLARGFRVVVRPDARDDAGGSGDASVASLIVRHGVTHLQCTPSMASTLVWDDAGRAALGRLSALLVGGEALPPQLAQSLRERVPGKVLNMYGPTETTVWSSTHAVAGDGEPVPIGRPIANTTLDVVDARLQPLPIGVTGELVIGGDGVTAGYLDRPELTSARFVPDPARPGARRYRTGDLARWRADGVVEFLGRNDQQVKIRGHRIELGEIEAALSTHAAVRLAVVALKAFADDDRRLVAYCTMEPATSVRAEELREFVRRRLPEYMLPSAFVRLEAMPLTPNGKIDRSALPLPRELPGAAGSPLATAGDDLTRRVTAAVHAALAGTGRPLPGLHDDLLSGGLDGFPTQSVLAALAAVGGRPLTLAELLARPTIAALSTLLRQAPEGAAAGTGSSRAAKRLHLSRRLRRGREASEPNPTDES
jgi:amino acid adenylation domain-containing protein